MIPVLAVSSRRDVGGSAAAYEIQASAGRDLMGHRHLRLRVDVARESQGALGFASATRVDVALRAAGGESVSVLVKDVAGGAELVAGRIRASVGADVDVYFVLQGPVDGRARVEVFHPDGIERVAPRVLDELFAVNGTGLDAGAPATVSWQERLVDPGVRAAFVHIERFGMVSEGQLVELLGGARATRRFALHFETYLSYVPFEVRVESTATEKRYVKGGTRDVAQP